MISNQPRPAHVNETTLVVIDSSIRRLGGHHLEYALHVLAAARRRGWSTRLVTHRDFGNDQAAIDLPVDRLLPLCEFDFFLVPSRIWWYRRLVDNYAAVRSLTGRVWQMLARRRGAGPTTNCTAPLAGPGAIQTTAGGRVSGLLRSAIKGAGRLCFRRMHDVRTASFVRILKQVQASLDPASGIHVFVPTITFDELRGIRHFLDRQPAARLWKWHLLFRYDLAYDPSTIEQVARESTATLARLFEDTTHSGTRSKQGAVPQRQGAISEDNNPAKFAGSVCQQAPRECVQFYTDTDALADEYSEWTHRPFTVLPLPHTHLPVSRQDSGTLQISYLGDARHEKGYHFLPAIVRSVHPECGDRVRFVVQSNFGIPGGEPGIAEARAELKSHSEKSVTVIEQALSSDEYRKTLCRSDLLLLLYEPERYRMRSSGVLIEALAAGIPVLVQAGSWLARQLTPLREAHLREYRAQADEAGPAQAMSWSQSEWREMPLDAAENRHSLESRWEATNRASAIPAGTTALWGAATVNPLKTSSDISRPDAVSENCELSFGRVPVVQLEAQSHLPIRHLRFACCFYSEGGELLEKAACTIELQPGQSSAWMVNVPDRATRVEIIPAIRAGGLPVEALLTSVEFLKGPHGSSQRVPTSQIGLIAGEIEDVPALLREFILFNDHYLTTARRHAAIVQKFHNADHLLQMLVAPPGDAAEGITSGPPSAALVPARVA